jgi:hypothetical protein
VAKDQAAKDEYGAEEFNGGKDDYGVEDFK